jgi:DNA-binding response OmpR family regulator
MERGTHYYEQENPLMSTAPASARPQMPPPMVDFGDDEYIVSFADVTVNLDRATVVRGKKKVTLTPAEFELLTLFVQNPERPLTRDQILESVWSYLASPNTRTVDAHVLRLRRKLEAEPDVPRHFVTVHKVGYRFSPNGI